MKPSAFPQPSLNSENLRWCAEILEAVAADRSLLAALSSEERRRLLMAAGRVSRPERQDAIKLVKALRRADRAEEKSADRSALAATQIREVRRAPVFAAPPRLAEGA